MDTRAFTRSWPALAAWGGGLVQLALGAGAVTGGDAAPRAIGILLVAAGGAGIVWGLTRLAGHDAARLGLAASLVGIVTLGTALLADPARTSVLAVTVGIALWAGVGIAAARAVRRESAGGRLSPGVPRESARSGALQVRPRAGVTGILLGAIVVAGAVTPALASTEAGLLAPDHGSHSSVTDHGH